MVVFDNSAAGPLRYVSMCPPCPASPARDATPHSAGNSSESPSTQRQELAISQQDNKNPCPYFDTVQVPDQDNDIHESRMARQGGTSPRTGCTHRHLPRDIDRTVAALSCKGDIRRCASEAIRKSLIGE